MLTSGVHYNKHLQSAWIKYGESNFKFGILEVCSKEELDEKEIYWINKFNANNTKYGYNQTLGGHGVYGYKHSLSNINLFKSRTLTEENNPNSKLDVLKVHEICELLIKGLSIYKIAEMFRVSKSTIQLIKEHKSWKSVVSQYSFI